MLDETVSQLEDATNDINNVDAEVVRAEVVESVDAESEVAEVVEVAKKKTTKKVATPKKAAAKKAEPKEPKPPKPAKEPKVAKPKEPKPPKVPKEPKVVKPKPPRKTAKPRISKNDVDDSAPLPTIEATGKREWFILKVQVNRETSIRDAIMRRVAAAGMSQLFGEAVIPTEKVTEIRGDRKKVVERKLYPGYLMISMELTEESWFMVRETFGVSDFTSSGGKPSPMLPHEVEKMLASRKTTPEQPRLRVGYRVGDQIKVKDGTFETCEGTVENIDYASGRVTVVISLFGRSTPVELEYWQVEAIS